jgi:hypothetical protein
LLAPSSYAGSFSEVLHLNRIGEPIEAKLPAQDSVSAGEHPSRFGGVLPQWLSKCRTLLLQIKAAALPARPPLEKRVQKKEAPWK